MNQAVKIFVDLIFIIALVMIGIGIITGMTDISSAKEYVNNATREISNSHFDSTVIADAVNSLNAEFNDDGESVSVTVYTKSGTNATYSTGTSHTPVSIAASTETTSVKVELKYKYHFIGNLGNIHSYSSFAY